MCLNTFFERKTTTKNLSKNESTEHLTTALTWFGYCHDSCFLSAVCKIIKANERQKNSNRKPKRPRDLQESRHSRLTSHAHVLRKVFGGAPLKAPISFFLRIPPSPLMRLEKKAKEKRAETQY